MSRRRVKSSSKLVYSTDFKRLQTIKEDLKKKRKLNELKTQLQS